jgi:hypothetical protein
MTALLGAVMAVSGALIAGRPALARIAMAAGLAVLAIAAAFAIRVWIAPEYWSYGPQIGFVATALGGLIGTVGDPVLRRGSVADRRRNDG